MDYNLKLTVRNGRILSAIQSLGYSSVAEFCRASDLMVTRVNALICFREKPLTKAGGNLTEGAQALCDVLGKLPEELWTYKQMGLKMGRCSFETKISELDLEQLSYKRLAEKLIENTGLSTREKEVLALRYQHDLPLHKVCETFGVTVERIRQVEMKAIRKIRNYAAENHIEI